VIQVILQEAGLMERDDSPRQRHGEGGPALTGAQGGGISSSGCPATIIQVQFT
jgi:hypothetical protein